MRRRRQLLVALVLVLAALLCPAPAHSTSQVEAYARYWAVSYGLDPDWFWNLALCESSGRVDAVNLTSGASGLFQFKPGSYELGRRWLNLDPTLAPRLSVFDPEWRPMSDPEAQSHVAAWLVAHGYSRWWECQP